MKGFGLIHYVMLAHLVFSKVQTDYLCWYLRHLDSTYRFSLFDLVVYRISKFPKFSPVVFRIRFMSLFLMVVTFPHQLGQFTCDPRGFIHAFDTSAFNRSVFFCGFRK